MADLHPITEQQLDKYEALANAATRGPWSRWEKRQPAEVVDSDGYSIGRIWTGVDADFIAAARTAVLALVAEVRSLRPPSEQESAGTYAIEK